MLSKIYETKIQGVAEAWREKDLHIEKFPDFYTSSNSSTTVVTCIVYIYVKRLLYIHAALNYKTL